MYIRSDPWSAQVREATAREPGRSGISGIRSVEIADRVALAHVAGRDGWMRCACGMAMRRPRRDMMLDGEGRRMRED